MKILLVCDQFFGENNGATISARRFADGLKELGNEVRIMGVGTSDQTPYGLKIYHLPIFDHLVTQQGMTFAKTDKKIITEAVDWADLVHFYVPFALTHKTIEYCISTHTCFTGAFHVQPENISSSVHLGKSKFFNNAIYNHFRNYVFQYCRHIHCPSNMIADQLRSHGYNGKLHVISNGIDSKFIGYRKLEKPEEWKDRFVILTVGRNSVEKRQDVLIRGISKSCYSDKIQLIIAGQGPRRKNLEELGKILPVPPVFGFYSKEELLDIISKSDLYVHSADVEIEAMACMEAFAGGLVPVIAKSPLSATQQFALGDNNLFEAGNIDQLAKKIDWWIEHPKEREEMGRKYSEYAERYSVRESVKQLQNMFDEEIEENGKK